MIIKEESALIGVLPVRANFLRNGIELGLVELTVEAFLGHKGFVGALIQHLGVFSVRRLLIGIDQGNYQKLKREAKFCDNKAAYLTRKRKKTVDIAKANKENKKEKHRQQWQMEVSFLLTKRHWYKRLLVQMNMECYGAVKIVPRKRFYFHKIPI